MLEFIYAYADIIQFFVYVFNSLAIAIAAIVFVCSWVKLVRVHTSCCSGDKSGHGFHGHMGHKGHHGHHGHKGHGAKAECCTDTDAAVAPEAPAADVDVAKFVD